MVVTPALRMANGLNVAQALVAPFDETFTVHDPSGSSAGMTVRNCRDHLALGRRRLNTDSAMNDQTLLVIGTRCVALDWIATVRSDVHKPQPHFSLRGLKVQQLPPQLDLIISRDSQEEARDASRRGESILSMEPDITLRVEAPDKARLSTPDWVADLTLYAYGDFLGDGSQQIVLQTNAGVVGGTYRASYLYLLSRKPRGWVVARSYPDET